jgi:hypothetical protein
MPMLPWSASVAIADQITGVFNVDGRLQHNPLTNLGPEQAQKKKFEAGGWVEGKL